MHGVCFLMRIALSVNPDCTRSKVCVLWLCQWQVVSILCIVRAICYKESFWYTHNSRQLSPRFFSCMLVFSMYRKRAFIFMPGCDFHIWQVDLLGQWFSTFVDSRHPSTHSKHPSEMPEAAFSKPRSFRRAVLPNHWVARAWVHKLGHLENCFNQPWGPILVTQHSNPKFFSVLVINIGAPQQQCNWGVEAQLRQQHPALAVPVRQYQCTLWWEENDGFNPLGKGLGPGNYHLQGSVGKSVTGKRNLLATLSE